MTLNTKGSCRSNALIINYKLMFYPARRRGGGMLPFVAPMVRPPRVRACVCVCSLATEPSIATTSVT